MTLSPSYPQPGVDKHFLITVMDLQKIDYVDFEDRAPISCCFPNMFKHDNFIPMNKLIDSRRRIFHYDHMSNLSVSSRGFASVMITDSRLLLLDLDETEDDEDDEEDSGEDQ